MNQGIVSRLIFRIVFRILRWLAWRWLKATFRPIRWVLSLFNLVKWLRRLWWVLRLVIRVLSWVLR